MAVEIEPLLQKLSALAPVFGRARDDIDAMVSRGRSSDFKGVMQNARLVLEAVLRSLVTEELKQTPGKAMLDELVTKFRQQANAGIVPTNILAHMGTVQAWGNLSSHDHAGSLADAPVQVGQEEAVASLNSVVAVLSWYANRRGLVLTPAAGITPVPPPVVAIAAPVAEAPPKSKTGLIVGVVAVLALVGGALAFALKPPTSTSSSEDPKVVAPAKSFAALDAVYRSWKEPLPPVACRRLEEADRLAQNVSEPNALKLIEKPSPEAAYLLARVIPFKQLAQKALALEPALACPGFANARYLAAQIAVAEKKLDVARTSLEEALTQAPTFLDARALLAGVLLQQDQVDLALAEAEKMVAADPDYAAGYLVRFSARWMKKDEKAAIKDLCTAVNKGSEAAKKKLEDIGGSCEAPAQ